MALVDIVAASGNDVIVADAVGTTTFEQHRWDSSGNFVSVHQDQAGSYAGPFWTSGLFADASNGVFYGLLLTGQVQGTNNNLELLWNRLNPDGSVNFSSVTTGTMPVSSGTPSVTFMQVGGDASANLHGAFLMSDPQPIGQGVYCYDYAGNAQGASAQNLTGIITPQDFLWPTTDNGLILFKSLTTSTDFGCSSPLTIPAAGAVALAKFNSGGGCEWNKALTLPTAAMHSMNFREGVDGSFNALVAFSGTIDFGDGPLQSTGTSSLALAKFDSLGNLLWSKSFGGAGSNVTVGSVGANGSGTVIITGSYSGTVDLGNGPLPATNDTFIAAFDVGGHLRWAKTVTVGNPGSLIAAVGDCGAVLATNSPGVDLGTGPLSAGQPANIGIAALGL
jgi:hypothetical protein